MVLPCDRHGAGGLLLVTAAMSYGSTLIAGSLSFLVSSRLFPMFVTSAAQQKLSGVAEAALQPYFSLSIPPLLDTLSAVTLAFILGLCLSALPAFKSTFITMLRQTCQSYTRFVDRWLPGGRA